jgi:NAD+ kinase
LEGDVRVLIVPNLTNPEAVAAASEVATWLSAEGFEPVFSAEDAEGCGLDDFGVPATEIGDLTLVTALGGDGTILKAVHLLGYTETPILGVNHGRLGFMTGAPSGSLKNAISSALAGEGRVERRATLEASVVMEGREVGRYRALNEVYVGKGSAGRVIEARLTINGTTMFSTNCDGIIVATPTGSTAYALSAGGPVVSPEVAATVVVPVAPHTFSARAIVTGPNDITEIHLPDPARSNGCVSVDGDVTPCRRAIESVTVKRCDSDVLLVKLAGREFYDVVSDEFFGG